MRFVILSILSWQPKLKKCKTCGSKHMRILEEDPVKSARHVSHHFIRQKDGGVQVHSHSSSSNFIKSICLHYREFSIWKLFNTKQEMRALCRIQGLVVWPWVCQHLQTFHVMSVPVPAKEKCTCWWEIRHLSSCESCESLVSQTHVISAHNFPCTNVCNLIAKVWPLVFCAWGIWHLQMHK